MRTSALLAAALLLAGCGGGGTNLTLINEQPKKTTSTSSSSSSSSDSPAPTTELDITTVAYRPCAHVQWTPSEPTPNLTTDVPPEGLTAIPFGQSRVFKLEPGCWDFIAVRGGQPGSTPGITGATSLARVILDEGENATWVPFRLDDIEVWW